MKKAKAKLTDRVLAYLKRTGKKHLTYGEIAERLDTASMAVGQCCAALGKRKEYKNLVKKVHNKADFKKIVNA